MLFECMLKRHLGLKLTVSIAFLRKISFYSSTILLELAMRVAGLVYDEAGGEAASRPKEFL